MKTILFILLATITGNAYADYLSCMPETNIVSDCCQQSALPYYPDHDHPIVSVHRRHSSYSISTSLDDDWDMDTRTADDVDP